MLSSHEKLEFIQAGEILQATLHKRDTAGSFVKLSHRPSDRLQFNELAGSFLKLTPNPISPELRTWLNHFSGQSNTFMRSSLREDAPLLLNYHCDLSPGFNRFRGNTNEMFMYNDCEEYTWVEGGWSDGGDWVDGVALKQIKIFSRTGEHWMLEVCISILLILLLLLIGHKQD